MDFNSLSKLKNKQAKQEAMKMVGKETQGFKGLVAKTKSVSSRALDYRPATVKYVDKHVSELDDKIEVMNRVFSEQLEGIYAELKLISNQEEISEKVIQDISEEYLEKVSNFKMDIEEKNGINKEMEMLDEDIQKFEEYNTEKYA